MKKAIISDAKQKRLDTYASIKKEFLELMSIDGSQKTAVIKDMSSRLKKSSSTIYKALN